jgi:uncharacterized protein (DUF885 family)
MQNLRWIGLVVALGLGLGPGACAPQTPPETPSEAPSETLHALFAREWQSRLEADPLLATAVGVHTFNDRLPSLAADELARQDALWRGYRDELLAIDRAALSPDDAINYDIFHEQLEARITGYRFGDHQIPFNADSGFHTSLARLPQDVPLNTVEDYEHYLDRLEALPRYFGEQIEWMRAGLRRGMTQPRVVLAGIQGTMTAHLVEDPTESVFWEPFTHFPPAVPAADQERLQTRAREVIPGSVVAAYQALLDFFEDEYIPGARESLGAIDLPDGAAYYQWKIHHFTTLDLTAEEIHALGLQEVSRIRAEMEGVIEAVGFAGSFDEFLNFLRTDPRFYAETPEQLLKEAAWIAKRMDGKLPALFATLPRLTYTVEAVPADLAPKYTAGRYVPAPAGSGQPGRYWVNTHALETRPLYNLEALSLHEAVPGHHFQMALNQERGNLPPFRQHSYIDAFGEGWGLYSEKLGLEAGFYTDPYSNFGRLTYEMWRACRLVVDTGVHTQGWSRQQVIDFLAANTALSLHEIGTETDRYISWPGQALAYKLGELKIQELRQRAEAALGPAFDLRLFHGAVLRNGSLPLSTLETVIDQWIAAQGGEERSG